MCIISALPLVIMTTLVLDLGEPLAVTVGKTIVFTLSSIFRSVMSIIITIITVAIAAAMTTIS